MNQALKEHFIGRIDAEGLVREFGSPLYIYDERTLRERIREL